MQNEEKNPAYYYDAENDIEYVSKSQLKRESHAIQDLGKALCELNKDQLARIPLDEQVLDAIALAQKIQNKRSALKRQYQFLGKLLRARDVDPIQQALQLLHDEHRQSLQQSKQSEHWRDQIVERGLDAVNKFADSTPQADRQKLRQLWRNLDKAKAEKEQTRIKRLIYKTIFSSLG